MILQNIANEDMKVNFELTAGPPDAVYVGDQGIDVVKIVPGLSMKCKAMGKMVGVSQIILGFSPVSPCPHTSATHDFVSGGGTIPSTATKCRAENQLILREEDSGSCVGSWMTRDKPPVAVPCECTIKIADAGQIKAKGR